MRFDERERLTEEVAPGRNAMPWGCTGRVGEWNQIERSTGALDSKTVADDAVEFFHRQELRDRQFPDRDDEARLQNLDLAVEPGGAVCNLLRVRDAIAAAGRFAGETTADGSEINFRAHGFFGQTKGFFEPAEERLARRPGKRFPSDRFAHARRLADEDYFAHDRAAGDGRWMHQRAAPAVAQACDVVLQSKFGGRAGHRFLSTIASR